MGKCDPSELYYNNERNSKKWILQFIGNSKNDANKISGQRKMGSNRIAFIWYFLSQNEGPAFADKVIHY